MDKPWLIRLNEHAAAMTERLYVSLLEDVEVFSGPVADTVRTGLAGLSQLAVTLGQCAAKRVRLGRRRRVARRVRDRQASAWRHST